MSAWIKWGHDSTSRCLWCGGCQSTRTSLSLGNLSESWCFHQVVRRGNVPHLLSQQHPVPVKPSCSPDFIPFSPFRHPSPLPSLLSKAALYQLPDWNKSTGFIFPFPGDTLILLGPQIKPPKGWRFKPMGHAGGRRIGMPPRAGHTAWVGTRSLKTRCWTHRRPQTQAGFTLDALCVLLACPDPCSAPKWCPYWVNHFIFKGPR